MAGPVASSCPGLTKHRCVNLYRRGPFASLRPPRYRLLQPRAATKHPTRRSARSCLRLPFIQPALPTPLLHGAGNQDLATPAAPPPSDRPPKCGQASAASDRGHGANDALAISRQFHPPLLCGPLTGAGLPPIPLPNRPSASSGVTMLVAPTLRSLSLQCHHRFVRLGGSASQRALRSCLRFPFIRSAIPHQQRQGRIPCQTTAASSSLNNIAAAS